jgi:hypothetical protein
LVSKLLLRCLACLASGGIFAVTNSGGFLEILEGLLSIIESSKDKQGRCYCYQDDVMVAAYLLASTAPWAVEGILRGEISFSSSNQQGKQWLKRFLSTLTELKTNWKCPFLLNGKQSLLSKPLPDTLSSASSGANGMEGGDKGRELMDEENEKAIPLSLHAGISDSFAEVLQVAIHFVELSLLSNSFDFFPEIYVMPWKILKERSLLYSEESFLSFVATHQASFSSSAFHEEMKAIVDEKLVGKSFSENFKSSSITHSGSNISFLSYRIGELYSSSKNASFLHSRLSIFTSETNDELFPACHLSFVEKYLLFSYIEDILNFFDIVVNEDGTKLGSIDLLRNHLLALNSLFSINQEKENNVSRIPVEYFIVESLFHRILSLPFNHVTHHLPLYKLILHFCKKDPAFPPMIALAMNTLFLIIPSLDLEAIRSLGNWFAFQFINTNCKWPFWDFWIGECNLLEDDADDDTNGNTEEDVIVQREETAVGEDASSTSMEEEETKGKKDKSNAIVSVSSSSSVSVRKQLYFIHFVLQKCYFQMSMEKLLLIIPKEFHHFLEENNNENGSLSTSSSLNVFYLSSSYNGVIKDSASQLKRLMEKRVSCDEMIDFIETVPSFIEEVRSPSFFIVRSFTVLSLSCVISCVVRSLTRC